eukprot:TRINITY_DN18294_c0_g1_i1.p4 TRINITY_DN18294_c0_g1~~TRINITY_DN18294_c0_g1_i1.p4  ORF type:complete len:270 (-),score=26.71 TRINITY_DN18294_c0_g1_i1:19-828(-)
MITPEQNNTAFRFPLERNACNQEIFIMDKMARAAVLTAPGKIEMKEFPIPAIGDDDILVKVEACGVCGTDGHEYKRDPFGLCPVVLGHEGTGEIVAIGKNISTDTAGKPLAVGDKVVTCIIPCGKCDACKNTPARTNLCENCGVYGLFPDDDIHLNGYFAEYILIRPGSTVFNVSSMTLDQRILVEPAAVAVHAVERAKTTGLLKFNTVVLVQGCGPIGLMVKRARKEQKQNIGQKQNKRRQTGRGDSCLLYTSPSPRDRQKSRMPSSA